MQTDGDYFVRRAAEFFCQIRIYVIILGIECSGILQNKRYQERNEIVGGINRAVQFGEYMVFSKFEDTILKEYKNKLY